MTLFAALRIDTKWTALLSTRVYNDASRALLRDVTPDLYWGMRESLVECVARGDLTSPTEFPFIAEHTRSNNLCFMDACYRYKKARELFIVAEHAKYTPEGVTALKAVYSLLMAILADPWYMDINPTVLPPVLQPASLTRLKTHIEALVIVYVARGNIAAKSPPHLDPRISAITSPQTAAASDSPPSSSTDTYALNVIRYLHLLTDDELVACRQTEYLAYVYALHAITLYFATWEIEHIKCLRCHVDKAGEPADMKVLAILLPYMDKVDVDISKRRHAATVPHTNMRTSIQGLREGTRETLVGKIFGDLSANPFTQLSKNIQLVV